MFLENREVQLTQSQTSCSKCNKFCPAGYVIENGCPACKKCKKKGVLEGDIMINGKCINLILLTKAFFQGCVFFLFHIFKITYSPPKNTNLLFVVLKQKKKIKILRFLSKDGRIFSINILS